MRPGGDCRFLNGHVRDPMKVAQINEHTIGIGSDPELAPRPTPLAFRTQTREHLPLSHHFPDVRTGLLQEPLHSSDAFCLVTLMSPRELNHPHSQTVSHHPAPRCGVRKGEKVGTKHPLLRALPRWG